MPLTQESVLNLLLAEGGTVKKADLVGKFKSSIDCDDVAERQRNRELFKTFVNNVAFVREIDGVRYVVVRKRRQRTPGEAERTAERPVEEEGEEESGEKDAPRTGEQQRPPKHTQDTGSPEDEGQEDADPERASETSDSPTGCLSPLQLALQRSQYKSVKVKRTLNFEVQRQDAASGHGKPYALPLRMPPAATRVEVRKLREDVDEPPGSPQPDASRGKRRPPPVETGGAVRSTKAPEEPREGATFPLEQAEHEWLVKCASGHWSQVYGLLLGDSQLAEKRDFMSGFTALHWAAKCGNSEMLVKIIDVSRRGGVEVDVNAKAHGGYTPLHIAALHDQEYILAMLVGEYGADAGVRDNCGKRAHHYLHKGVSPTVREMLAGPKVRQDPSRSPQDKEEPDLLPDLPKGLHSISRLFQPHVSGHKKKHKQRPGFYSLSDEPSEERDDSSSFRYRLSDVFM